MPVPLALAAPATVAGLAYLNARTSFSNDARLLGPVFWASFKTALKERNDRLNIFYILEANALGKHANSTFLIFEGRSWTYKQTYDMVLKYGTWFRTVHGVKPKEVVVMDFMNSDKFIFLWFGLWSIGAKPAFVNYNLKGKALAHCIQVSTARLAIIDSEVTENITEEVKNQLPNIEFLIFTLEMESSILSTEGIRSEDSTRSESKASNMAVLIYTSGTTGLPKPAIFTAMVGVMSVISIGATISIGKKFSTQTFWNEVRETKATIIQYVGETCRYLLSAPPQFDPVTGENLDQKNVVRMAFGNGLRPDIWNRFKERFGIEAIAEFYSATESASGSWNYSRNDFSKGAIGRFGTVALTLLGSTMEIVQLDWETEAPFRDPSTKFCKRVKKGDPGELLYKLDPANISKTFQGYFNNTSSTQSKIMRDVFVPGDAYFRTGDIITLDSEGRTFFNDRIGDTYRWKSENISTNEVAEALGTHPSVVEANVYGIELPHHDGRAGCVQIEFSELVNTQLLQGIAKHVQTQLPRFAIPLFLRLSKEMQRTGTLKQQKHVVRQQGADLDKIGDDELYWLKGGTYVKFGKRDWEELKGGKVRL
ncbi:hypothetical protein B7494_g3224 [Chlorociboria aeruginascens]|nr:hypothetical protein B7494_g3224 [Chlorociboria aeruginascens]